MAHDFHGHSQCKKIEIKEEKKCARTLFMGLCGAFGIQHHHRRRPRRRHRLISNVTLLLDFILERPNGAAVLLCWT